MKHFHLDPVGGVAGDMFVAALLDLHPELADGAIAAVRAAGLGTDISLSHLPFTDGILSGSRFEVSATASPATGGHGHTHDHVREHDHAHGHQHGHEHEHVHWSALRARLQASELEPAVCARAVAIFSALADAEARVHDKPVDAVAFHEVGAWDSIADIVASAFLLEALGEASWSIGPLPLGSGRVDTQHGLLPVPAPATVLLLEGFACFDDGRPGERVTPTGAAILRYLAPAAGIGPVSRPLCGTGYGFGTRRLEGMSNVLRVLAFETPNDDALQRDQVITFSFEVDDQSAEDLALGLDALRAIEGVLDVTQSAAIGKRGRMMSAIQVLARPESLDRVARACFAETSTLGLRLASSDRLILSRHEVRDAHGVRVKVSRRPDGETRKADLLDVADAGSRVARDARRRAAEQAVGGAAGDDEN